MDAVGTGGKGNVRAGINEKSSLQLGVLCFCFAKDLHRLAGESFKIAGREIFFAQLDVVDGMGRGFGNFVEQTAAAREFVSGKGAAVGDVAE